MNDDPRRREGSPATRVYVEPGLDSGRWAHVRWRPGDIVISTGMKCGTTWMQTISALLVFQDADFPALPLLSPCVEDTGIPIETLVERYACQSNRRIFKTHTPLDGIPFEPDLTYLIVHRDPRDAFISLMHHRENMQRNAINPDPVRDELWARVDALFAGWLGSLDDPSPPVWSQLHHALTFWAERDRPNVHLLHYRDLKTDLVGQMARIARALDIELTPHRLEALSAEAGFEAMKRRARHLVPNTDTTSYRLTDPNAFFRSGTHGQWVDLLDARSLAHYDAHMRRLPTALAHWLENGGPVIDDRTALPAR